MRFSWPGWLLLVTILAGARPIAASDQLSFGPPPAWVEPVPPSPAPAQSGDSPITVMLMDAQAKLDPEQASIYSHTSVRLNTAQGLAAGNIIAAWNPEFGTITVHRVQIRRGTQLIDVLASGQKFSILRREKDLEQQILNGQLTAALQPEGLQVGDILEYQMTLTHRDPTLKGKMELKSGFDFPLRVERAQLRVTTPARTPVRVRTANGMSAPLMTTRSGEKIASWNEAPLLPQVAPEFAPPRFAAGRSMELTSFQSWDEVSALFLPLFDQASLIPPNSPLQAEIAGIRAAGTSPEQRAALALKLVEDKVRYVNLALGTAGLVPANADDTWKRRFGDCKAKTALLTGVLRELGIDAEPVLVHSTDGDGLDQRLPMVGAFNHVLVRARIGGRTYWLDGTRTGDSNLATLTVPFYHWGLPVTRNAVLVRIQPPPLAQPTSETIITTDASAGATKPAPTTIEIISRGDNANLENSMLAAMDPAIRDQAIRALFDQRLDKFEVDQVTVDYDPGKQQLRLAGKGRQPLELDRGGYWAEVPTLGYKADFRRTSGRDRDAPVQVGFPTFTRSVQIITLPIGPISATPIKSSNISTTLAGVEYRRSISAAAGKVTIETTSRSLVPEISLAEALAAESRLRELDKDDVWIRMSTSSPVAASKVVELIGREAKTADDYVKAAIKLIEQGSGGEALSALDKAVELAPGETAHRALRAQLRMQAGDLAGAEADAIAGLKSPHNQSSVRILLADVYARQGKLDAAYAQTRLLANVDNARTQVERGRLLSLLNRTDEALAAFAKALGYEPDPLTHYHRAMAMPAAARQERRRELDAALKLSPKDASTLASLGGLARQLGDHEQALRLLDQALLKSPDDLDIRHHRAIALELAGKSVDAKREFDAILAKDLSSNQLNNFCWAKALTNVALERALAECDRSLAISDDYAAHDSKGMVLLRLGRLDEAIAEFSRSLAQVETSASYYARSLAHARKGNRAQSDADAAKALARDPGLTRMYDYVGLTR